MNDRFHSKHQTDLPLELQILNISMNMARISGWVAESYESKRELINRFIEQTESYLNDIKLEEISEEFSPTLVKFKEEFKKLKNLDINENDKMLWSERALTWADILQHRAKLL